MALGTPVEFDGTTTAPIEVAHTSTSSVALAQFYTDNPSGELGVPVSFDGTTNNTYELGAPVSFDGTTLAGEGFLGEPVSFDGETIPDFGIVSAGAYEHGESCVLTVVGINDTYTVRWSPSSSNASAAGSVELVVGSDNLDGLGDGTITVTSERGVALYGTTGYLFVVRGGTQSVARAATLVMPAGRSMVTLVAPLVEPGLGIDAIPDLDVGDTVIWWDVLPSGDVVVETDRSFNASPEVRNFKVEAHVPNLGYTNVAQQTFEQDYELFLNVTSTSVVSTTREYDGGQAAEFTSESLPALSVAVNRTVTMEHTSSSGLEIDFDPTANVNEAFTSTNAVTFSSTFTSAAGVPEITAVPDMTHGIQTIIVGINFGE